MLHSHQVEGDRVPQGYGSHFGEAADSELVQAAVAAEGVGEFGDRRALFQNGLRLVGRHALAEGEHLVAVRGAASVRVAAAFENPVFVSHRRGDLAAALFHGGDVIVGREAAVHHIVRWDLVVLLADGRVHRSHLAAVAAIWLPSLLTSTETIMRASPSVANCTLYAGRKPPSAIFMDRVSGSVVEQRASSPEPCFALFLLLLQLGEVLQRLFDTLRAFASRTLGRRATTSVAGVVLRIVVALLTQLLHLLGRFTRTRSTETPFPEVESFMPDF